MSKIVLVVGMHRSATSLVARSLHMEGCHMGDDMIEPHKSNPKGHYECRKAVNINNALLFSNSGTWRQPPEHIEPSSKTLSDIKKYIKMRSNTHDMWGVKDPRFCLTWPVWLPLLRDHDLHVVTVWRGPEEIARSLNERDGIEIDRGVELAKEYHKRTLELLRNI